MRLPAWPSLGSAGAVVALRAGRLAGRVAPVLVEDGLGVGHRAGTELLA